VKAAEKKKRKRKTSPPSAIETLMILTPALRVVESDEEGEATEEPPVVKSDR
jgi:hypothetical protein